MHEFSLASEVINLAYREAEKNKSSSVSEITIEAGNLSGVEVDAFESALTLLSEGSILDGASRHIIRIAARGKCNACNLEFEMDHRMSVCPQCKSFPSEIMGGNEFRVVSMVVE